MQADPNYLFAYKRLDDYPEHLAAVGLVTTEWVRLEKIMQMTLVFLLRDAQNAIAIFNASISFRTRFEILQALVACMPEKEMIPGYSDELRRIADLSTERNAVIHGDLVVRASDNSLVQITYKRAQPAAGNVKEHADPQRLIELANGITEAILRLDHLNRELAVARGLVPAEAFESKG